MTTLKGFYQLGREFILDKLYEVYVCINPKEKKVWRDLGDAFGMLSEQTKSTGRAMDNLVDTLRRYSKEDRHDIEISRAQRELRDYLDDDGLIH